MKCQEGENPRASVFDRRPMIQDTPAKEIITQRNFFSSCKGDTFKEDFYSLLEEHHRLEKGLNTGHLQQRYLPLKYGG